MRLTTSLPVSIPSMPPKQICDSRAQSRLGFAIRKLINPKVPIKPIIRSDVAIALLIGLRVIGNKGGTIKNPPPSPSAMAETLSIDLVRELLKVTMNALAATAPRAIPIAPLIGKLRHKIKRGTAKIEPPAPVRPSTRSIITPIKIAILSSYNLFVPWHFRQQHPHSATISDTGKDKTRANKSCKAKKPRVDEQPRKNP